MGARYDVAIIGLGAMGSATAYHLAKCGMSVIGFDQFRPPDDFGSSHGHSRVIREAYFEHPDYVPLVQRAYELWEELEIESGQQLFLQTGGLMLGRAESTLVQGAKRSAEIHNLSYEWLSADQISERFPAFHPKPEAVAIWEPRAGVLFPEKCIEAHLAQASAAGADLHFEEKALTWESSSGAISLKTAKGEYVADKLVLAAGPWISDLLRDLEVKFEVTRQPLFWLSPTANAEMFSPDRFPIYIWEYDVERYFYGFPDLGNGVKAAFHYQGETTRADNVDRVVNAEEEAAIAAVLRDHIPDAAGEVIERSVCMYTNTEDLHFIIDSHPDSENVWILSPCSGHGFKFSNVIGAMMPDLIPERDTEFDLSLFSLDRLRGSG